jgi:hypothetical protein
MDNKEFTFSCDWEKDGMLDWSNAKTLKRYKELTNQHPDIEKHGCFFAFGNESFCKGLSCLIERGVVKSVKEIVSDGGGMYGTPDGIRAVYRAYDDRNKIISQECDPQEVYCYEYNNHESCIAYDGDLEAFRLVIYLFGEEAARRIKRFNAYYPYEYFFGQPDVEQNNNKA